MTVSELCEGCGRRLSGIKQAHAGVCVCMCVCVVRQRDTERVCERVRERENSGQCVHARVHRVCAHCVSNSLNPKQDKTASTHPVPVFVALIKTLPPATDQKCEELVKKSWTLSGRPPNGAVLAINLEWQKSTGARDGVIKSTVLRTRKCTHACSITRKDIPQPRRSSPK